MCYCTIGLYALMSLNISIIGLFTFACYLSLKEERDKKNKEQLREENDDDENTNRTNVFNLYLISNN